MQAQAPFTQVTWTAPVQAAAVALGLTPQTCAGVGTTTFSSTMPLQLSSTPLHDSVALLKMQG